VTSSVAHRRRKPAPRELERGTEFCSTRKAAQMLDVSLSHVQTMVENGQLTAWKTAGGHRRILVESVVDFARKRMERPRAAAAAFRVLLCDDDAKFSVLLEKTVESWNAGIELRKTEDAYVAMLTMAHQVPDLLILDLMMDGVDTFRLLNAVRAMPRFQDMNIIVATAMSRSKIAHHGGLPPGITVFPKPVPFYELKGYVQALAAGRGVRSAY
jgi:excisionase family DNA binding protein